MASRAGNMAGFEVRSLVAGFACRGLSNVGGGPNHPPAALQEVTELLWNRWIRKTLAFAGFNLENFRAVILLTKASACESSEDYALTSNV
jgi:hypothetical protein